jgi:hypothetical protein
VPDEMSRPQPHLGQKPPELLMDGSSEIGAIGGGWIGMVNEFRNQLSIFLAGTNELFSKLPRAVAAQVADTLDDMESSAEFLQTLLTWMDASVGPGAKTISDVEDLLLRAKMLASTGLSPRVSVVLDARPAGVRNRGAAIECALAALITELGRVSDAWPPGEAGSSDGFDVSVSVNPQRGSLSILLSSGGGPPAPGGWRVSLAEALLSQVGGTVQALDRDPSGRGAGFDVRFRFQ